MTPPVQYRPRPLWKTLVMSVAVIAMFLYTVPQIVVTAYDMTISAPCGDGLEAAILSWQEETANISTERDTAIVANDYKYAAQRVRDKIAALICPTYAAPAQARLTGSLDELYLFLDAISHGGTFSRDELYVKYGEVAKYLTELRELV